MAQFLQLSKVCFFLILADFERKKEIFWSNYETTRDSIDNEVHESAKLLLVPEMLHEEEDIGFDVEKIRRVREKLAQMAEIDSDGDKSTGGGKDLFEYYKKILLRLKKTNPEAFLQFMVGSQRVLHLHEEKFKRMGYEIADTADASKESKGSKDSADTPDSHELEEQEENIPVATSQEIIVLSPIPSQKSKSNSILL